MYFSCSKVLNSLNSELYAKNHSDLSHKFLLVIYFSANKSNRSPFTFAENKVQIELLKRLLCSYSIIQIVPFLLVTPKALRPSRTPLHRTLTWKQEAFPW